MPKLARNKHSFFELNFVSRFEQWEFFNVLNFNFFNAPFSYVDKFDNLNNLGQLNNNSIDCTSVFIFLNFASTATLPILQFPDNW